MFKRLFQRLQNALFQQSKPLFQQFPRDTLVSNFWKSPYVIGGGTTDIFNPKLNYNYLYRSQTQQKPKTPWRNYRFFSIEQDQKVIYRGLPEEKYKWGAAEISTFLRQFSEHHKLSPNEQEQLQTCFRDKSLNDLYADERILKKQLGNKVGGLLYNELSGASPYRHLAGWVAALFKRKKPTDK